MKKSLRRKPEKDREPGPDLFRTLKEEITTVRTQGEYPVRDSASFSRFICDLCSTTHTIHELRQCAVCGRWACTGCWTADYYLCNSCNGILRLHLIRKGG